MANYTKTKVKIVDGTTIIADVGYFYDKQTAKEYIHIIDGDVNFTSMEKYFCMQEEPADWEDNYTSYYTRAVIGGVYSYTPIPAGESAPTFVAGIYYEDEGYEIAIAKYGLFAQNNEKPFYTNRMAVGDSVKIKGFIDAGAAKLSTIAGTDVVWFGDLVDDIGIEIFDVINDTAMVRFNEESSCLGFSAESAGQKVEVLIIKAGDAGTEYVIATAERQVTQVEPLPERFLPRGSAYTRTPVTYDISHEEVPLDSEVYQLGSFKGFHLSDMQLDTSAVPSFVEISFAERESESDPPVTMDTDAVPFDRVQTAGGLVGYVYGSLCLFNVDAATKAMIVEQIPEYEDLPLGIYAMVGDSQVIDEVWHRRYWISGIHDTVAPVTKKMDKNLLPEETALKPVVINLDDYGWNLMATYLTKQGNFALHPENLSEFIEDVEKANRNGLSIRLAFNYPAVAGESFVSDGVTMMLHSEDGADSVVNIGAHWTQYNESLGGMFEADILVGNSTDCDGVFVKIDVTEIPEETV